MVWQSITTSLGLRFLTGLALLGLSNPVAAEEYQLHTFEKKQLTTEFHSEGGAAGDINNDGHGDVIVGPYWYAGPDFEKRTAYYEPKKYQPKGYSHNFLTFTYDFNGDASLDILVVGWPGKETTWYENPGEAAESGYWKSHLCFDVVDNESPGFGDITGDGKPELLFHTEGFYGFAEPDWQDPTKKWKFTRVSEKIAGGRYTHGLGIGDVNGDGRTDMLTKDGWLEQPEKITGQPWPFRKFQIAPEAAQIYAFDFDADGDADILTSLHAHGFGLALHRQTQPSEFDTEMVVGKTADETPYGVVFSQAHSIALADMNGDAVPDFVTGKRFWAHGGRDPGGDQPAVLYWFQTKQTAAGVEFVPHKIDDDSGVGTQVCVADVNGDELPDVVVGNKKGAFVFIHRVKAVTKQQWEEAQPQRSKD